MKKVLLAVITVVLVFGIGQAFAVTRLEMENLLKTLPEKEISGRVLIAVMEEAAKKFKGKGMELKVESGSREDRKIVVVKAPDSKVIVTTPLPPAITVETIIPGRAARISVDVNRLYKLSSQMPPYGAEMKHLFEIWERLPAPFDDFVYEVFLSATKLP